MTFYKVTSIYYDNGHASATLDTIQAPEKPADTVEYLEQFDRYCEYFTDKNDAIMHAQNVK